MLEACQISKSYPNGYQALQPISFELHSGELVGLIGPNGAGKSTLIHVLCGLLKPTSGNVLRGLTDPTKVAWVSQTTSLDWYLSVYENALIGAKIGGLRGEKARACALKWLNHLELRGAQHLLRPDQLSGGQQRRLQVARALAQEPELIFLDEPTTGLDLVASRVVMQELKRRAQQGASILVSSHELSLVEEFASHLLWMDRGKVTFDARLVEGASLRRVRELRCRSSLP